MKQLWLQQYSLGLQTDHAVKTPNSHSEFKVSDVVLIEGNTTKNKLYGSLVRLKDLSIPGCDKKIHCNELKTSGALLKKAVQHLYPSELQRLSFMN